MNKKIAALLTTLFLSFISSAWAYQMPPQPLKCPDVSEIQSTRFATVKGFRDGSYGAIQFSDYKTEDSWAFVVINIMASAPREAMQKATSALPSITFNSGPTYFSQSNIWACFYNIAGDYQAFALTPLPTQAVNSQAIFNAIKPH